MASGDPSLRDYGVFNISDGTLVAAVDGITGPISSYISGGGLHFVPAGEGQINLLQVDIEP